MKSSRIPVDFIHHDIQLGEESIRQWASAFFFVILQYGRQVFLDEPVKDEAHRLTPKRLLDVLPLDPGGGIGFQLSVAPQRLGYAFVLFG